MLDRQEITLMRQGQRHDPLALSRLDRHAARRRELKPLLARDQVEQGETLVGRERRFL